MEITAQVMCGEMDEFIQTAKAAEEAGYDGLGVVDSHLLWRDVYVYLTRGLAATERIPFATAVTNPYTRHLTVTASIFATLAQLHPGRLTLGMGAGDSSMRTMGLRPVPVKQLVAAVPTLRELLAGGTVELDGNDVHLRFVEEPVRVPIMLASSGPKSLRLAGGVADTVLAAVGASPGAVKWAIDQIRGGAEDAGRDPASVRVAVMLAMWVSDDQEEAWDRTRFHPAAAANHYEDIMKRNPNHGLPPEMTRVVPERHEYDYYAGHLDHTAEHLSIVPDDVVDDFTIAGPAEKCLEKIRVLAELGVSEVATGYLTGEIEQIERVGREIIPHLAPMSSVA